MKKRIGAFLLVLILTVGLIPAPAQAAETGSFLQGYTLKDGILTLDMAKMPKDGQFQLTLGGQPLENPSVQTVQEAQLPVTVYCLVDVSGSMYNNQLAMIRKVLESINGKMGEGDNMVICTLGNKVKTSDLLVTKEQRAAAIKALKLKDENTNLYAGIVDCLNEMKASTILNERRCLVVFSDGEDAVKNGYTRQEVESTITSTRIPVYTVSVVRDTSPNAKKEASKKFGSFARISSGGAHFTPMMEDDNGSKAGREIWNSMQNGLRLQADLNGMTFDFGKDTTLLRVTYKTETASYEDTLEIYTEELPPPPTQPSTEEPAPAPAATEPSVPAETTANNEEPEPEPTNWLMWVVIGAVLLLAIVVVTVILIQKKKKEEQLRRQRALEEEARKALEKIDDLDVPPTGPMVPEVEESIDLPVRKILMVALRHEATQYSFALAEGQIKTMGKQADIVLNIQDPQLSRRHCQIKWEGERIYIRDDSSMNGSFIHGVPVKGKGWMPLENYGILHVGTYDYRVSFDEEVN